ncbi:MAG: 4Fe-4S dicluster domain-containing protein [Verrucomicrobia bacterium]|nr:4Fe-4S dicluster domain-containing protein [Verrucomicrobiota bacterium]
MSENTKFPVWARRIGRWLALAAAVALGLSPQTAVWFPSLSPHIALGGALAAKTASVVTLVGLPVLVLVLIWPRWFCHHACPTGFLQDLFSRRKAAEWRRWPPIGKWLLVITLGGAALGYPVFLWLDPLAIFNGFLNAAWHKPVTLAAGALLPVVLVFNFFLPKVWCQRICPLGAMQELLALARRHKRTPVPVPHQKRLARRAFIGVCAGAAGAVLVQKASGRTAPPLRPPGALPEADFTGACVRCGNCGAVCPSQVIHQDLKSVAGLLAPVLRYDKDYCRENCNRCGQACPSGAIARLPLAEKEARLIGVAKIDLDACALANGEECTACIRSCPFEALVVVENAEHTGSEPRLIQGRCNGCGACESVCPVWPKVAIRVAPLPGQS